VPGEDEFRGKGVTTVPSAMGPFLRTGGWLSWGVATPPWKRRWTWSVIASHIDVVAPAKIVGDAILIERLNRAKNISVHECCSVQEIKGDNFVKSIAIKDTRREQ